MSTEAANPTPDQKPAATEPAPTAARPEEHANPVVVTATISGIVAVGLLALFLRFTEPSYRSAALPSFVAMIVIVAGSLIAAMAWPRATAHLLGALFGLVSWATGLFTLIGGGIPLTLSIVLIAMGAGSLVLAQRSYQYRSRPSWAFLAATLGVMGVCTLFGAPKIRNLIGTTMWLALMIPGLLTVASVAFGLIAKDYRETITRRR